MAKVVVRKLRHWKQRFDRDAEFIWRRPIMYRGERVEVGSLVPDDLGPVKTKRFWEASTIELARFEEPNVLTGQVEPPRATEPRELPEGVTVRSTSRGSWFQVHVAGEDKVHRVNGKRALAALLDELASKPKDAPGETDEDDGEHGDGDDDDAEDETAEDKKDAADWLE